MFIFSCSHHDQNSQPAFSRFGAMLMIAVFIMFTIGIIPRDHHDDLSTADTSAQQLLSDECIMIQHLIYAPCQHDLVRRVSLPSELIGKTRSDAEAYFADWQITSYAASEIRMEQTFDLFCPQHIVLKPDESGILSVWQNTYGDAMSLVETLSAPVTDLPDDVQDTLRRGIGFDSMEELTQWLESIES